MEMNKSEWNFLEKNVVENFESHIEKSVPYYRDFHRCIRDLSSWFLKDGFKFYDIGSSTGSLMSKIKIHTNKKVDFIGLEESEEMCKIAKNKDVEVVQIDVTNGFDFKDACMVTAVLTLQFIDENKRQDLLNRIYKGLNKGSCLIIVEKILGNSVRLDRIFRELHHEKKMDNGIEPLDILKKDMSLRSVMNPLSLEENIEMLKIAGFKDIDTFLKYNNFVGLIAIK